MYALISNNQITEVGELQKLFPNETQPTHLYALQHGALPIVDSNREDEKFYWVTFDKYTIETDVVKRNYVNTPKALNDVIETPQGQTESLTTKGLKSQYIAKFKHTANSMLANTDWMVIRKAERNVAIPNEVATKRSAILAECDRLTTAVQSAQDMPAFITAVQSANWNNNVE